MAAILVHIIILLALYSTTLQYTYRVYRQYICLAVKNECVVNNVYEF